MKERVAKLICACVFVFTSSLQAQQKKGLLGGKPLEVGVMLGASHYIGDLTKFVDFKETNPAGGLICRYHINDWVTLRGSVWFGQISGDDKNYDNDAFRKARNLNFKSNIFEFSGTVEWNLLGFEETTQGRPWSPYLFAGLGVYKYNPKTTFKYITGNRPNGNPIHDVSLRDFDGQTFELQNLATEGQESTQFNDRQRYALTQLSLPLGFGVKKQTGEKFAIGIEIGLRATYNDYLDDISKTYAGDAVVAGNNKPIAAALADRSVEIGLDSRLDRSQRGTSSFPDLYMFSGITLTYKLGGGKQRCFQF